MSQDATDELVARLANNIRYGCHSISARVGRSDAGQELRKRGREAIAAMQAYLKLDPRPDKSQILEVEEAVDKGFAMLASWIRGDLSKKIARDSGLMEVTHIAGLSH